MASIIKVDTIKDTSDNTLLTSSSGNVSISNDLVVDTDTLYVDTTNNKVGIGIVPSGARLEVSNGDSGVTPFGDVFFEDDAGFALALATPNTDSAVINFADPESNNVGQIGYDHSDNSMTFDTNGSEAMRIDSSGNVGIGTSSPNTVIDARQTSTGGSTQIRVYNTDNSNTTTQTAGLFLAPDSRGNGALIFAEKENADFSTVASRDVSLVFSPVLNNSQTEAMRITSSGSIGIAQTNPIYPLHIKDAGNAGSSDENGQAFDANGSMYFQTNNTSQMFLNDSSGAAGTHNYILFRYQGATIGDIDTTNNTLIRYNTFTGGHWSQFHDGTNPELKKGTVMSLTGDKLEYSKCEKTITKEDGTEEVQKFEIAGTHEIGSEVTVPNDEYGEENSTTTATVVSNYNADHLVKVKVSDSVADKGVYGVWAGKYNDGDLSVEALGTSTIRIKQGEVLEVGDLLESAGDGTAQKQSDGIIKNSTIAKVTSPTPIETFDDNSFLVSCVLYCG